ncbi:MAG: hypothetical protein LUG27_10380 [Clostridiales bacterium]|nr:hypothetical protein [Clostridiales bacterium]
MIRDKIDVHAHYLPSAYNSMLERRGMKFLDGGFPKPDWNVEIQLASMEQLGTGYGRIEPGRALL